MSLTEKTHLTSARGALSLLKTGLVQAAVVRDASYGSAALVPVVCEDASHLLLVCNYGFSHMDRLRSLVEKYGIAVEEASGMTFGSAQLFRPGSTLHSILPRLHADLAAVYGRGSDVLGETYFGEVPVAVSLLTPDVPVARPIFVPEAVRRGVESQARLFEAVVARAAGEPKSMKVDYFPRTSMDSSGSPNVFVRVRGVFATRPETTAIKATESARVVVSLVEAATRATVINDLGFYCMTVPGFAGVAEGTTPQTVTVTIKNRAMDAEQCRQFIRECFVQAGLLERDIQFVEAKLVVEALGAEEIPKASTDKLRAELRHHKNVAANPENEGKETAAASKATISKIEGELKSRGEKVGAEKEESVQNVLRRILTEKFGRALVRATAQYEAAQGVYVTEWAVGLTTEIVERFRRNEIKTYDDAYPFLFLHETRVLVQKFPDTVLWEALVERFKNETTITKATRDGKSLVFEIPSSARMAASCSSYSERLAHIVNTLKPFVVESHGLIGTVVKESAFQLVPKAEAPLTAAKMVTEKAVQAEDVVLLRKLPETFALKRAVLERHFGQPQWTEGAVFEYRLASAVPGHATVLHGDGDKITAAVGLLRGHPTIQMEAVHGLDAHLKALALI